MSLGGTHQYERVKPEHRLRILKQFRQFPTTTLPLSSDPRPSFGQYGHLSVTLSG
jgi:hypothetical protein